MHHRATPLRRKGSFWLAALVGLGPGMATAATVVAIDSGDTVRVREGRSVQTIRLACLDAPELAQAPHGPASQAALRQLLPVGAAVTLNPPPGPDATEAVAELVTATGTNVNLQMVRAGQAFPTLTQPSQCDPLRYAEAENMARFQRLGVWQVKGGIQRPWQWQANKREQDQEQERRRALQSLPAPTIIRSAPSRLPTQSGSTQTANYQQCMSYIYQQVVEYYQNRPVPKGLFESFCSCLTTPSTTMETAMDVAGRCRDQMLERLSRSKQ